jgi:hypothetical protein
MTRSHKTTDRDHAGLANGTAVPEANLPKYFGKAGYAGESPSKTKKQGGGKSNWGSPGLSELEDYSYNPTKPRRRTNSFSAAAGHNLYKSKFEAVDPQAVIEFDEDLHGASAEDLELEKMSSSSSAGTTGSVEEEEESAGKGK